MNCHILSGISIFLGVIFAIFGYWFGLKEAKYWQDLWRKEADLHRRNLEHCHKVIVNLAANNEKKGKP